MPPASEKIESVPSQTGARGGVHRGHCRVGRERVAYAGQVHCRHESERAIKFFGQTLGPWVLPTSLLLSDSCTTVDLRFRLDIDDNASPHPILPSARLEDSAAQAVVRSTSSWINYFTPAGECGVVGVLSAAFRWAKTRTFSVGFYERGIWLGQCVGSAQSEGVHGGKEPCLDRSR